VAKQSKYEKALLKYAQDLNQAAMRVLGRRTIGKNKTYGEASGALRKSLKFELKGGKIMFGSPLPYSQFIYWGVNGTEKRRGSPFSYGSKQPPMDAIKKWMRVKPLRLRDAKGSFVSQQTKVNKKTGKKTDPMDGPAFLIARSIKKKGIAGLKYYEKAFDETYKKAQKKLSEALAEDLFDELDGDLDDK
jgi:hypothetical protein